MKRNKVKILVLVIMIAVIGVFSFGCSKGDYGKTLENMKPDDGGEGVTYYIPHNMSGNHVCFYVGYTFRPEEKSQQQARINQIKIRMQLNLSKFKEYLNTDVDIASGFKDSGKIKWYISYTTTSKKVKLYQESSNQNFADELNNTDVIFEETFDIKELLKENEYDENQNLLDNKYETSRYSLLIVLYVPNSNLTDKNSLFLDEYRVDMGKEKGNNLKKDLVRNVMKVEATFKGEIEYK